MLFFKALLEREEGSLALFVSEVRMRNMLLLTGVGALAFTPVTVPTAAHAHAQGANGQVEVCESLVDSGSYASIGECVSEMRTSPVRFCQFLKSIDIYPIFLYDPSINDFVAVENEGQCVSLIRQF